MQHDQQQPVLPPCPICHAPGQVRTWHNLLAGNVVRLSSDAHLFTGAPVHALVCEYCGNIQLFTNPQDLRKT